MFYQCIVQPIKVKTMIQKYDLLVDDLIKELKKRKFSNFEQDCKEYSIKIKFKSVTKPLN